MSILQKLKPTQGEIPDIDPAQRGMKLRCTGKGEALWAHFDLLYPIIITSRKYLGHLLNGAAQDVDVMAVKVDGKMHKGLPSHVGAGALDIIVQSKGATSIELVLMCRIDPTAGEEPADAESVTDAVAALEAEAADEQAAADHKPRPEDPPMRPKPADPRNIELEHVPESELLSAEGPFPTPLPPEVAAAATEQLQNMLDGKSADETSRRAMQAFVDADGDPTEALKSTVLQNSTVEFGRSPRKDKTA